MPADFLTWRRALRIGVDGGLDASLFRSLDLLPAPAAGHPGPLATAHGQYDLISMNQVFEYVRDDRALFADVTRRMTPRAILNVCFSGIARRSVSTHDSESAGPVHHRYGSDDVPAHFNSQQLGLHQLAIQVEDGCTGSIELVYLFMSDLTDMALLRQCFESAGDPRLRLL